MKQACYYALAAAVGATLCFVFVIAPQWSSPTTTAPARLWPPTTIVKPANSSQSWEAQLWHPTYPPQAVGQLEGR